MDSPMESDPQLLRKFIETGDTDAFEILVERHSGMVGGVAARFTGNAAAALDVTQSVFAALAGKAEEGSCNHLAGRLHTAAVAASRDVLKEAAAICTQKNGGFNDLPPGADCAWAEIYLHLDEAVSLLPSDERELIVVHYLEKQPLQRIAASTRATEQSSRRKLQRGIISLRRLLDSRGVRINPDGLTAVLSALPAPGPSASAPALTFAALRPFLQKTPAAKLQNGTAAALAAVGGFLTSAASVAGSSLGLSGFL